jgi:hypothetical protein
MTTLFRIALLVLGFAMSGSVAYPQTTIGPDEPLLGRVHLWVKVGRADLGSGAAREWGVNTGGYLGLEAYRSADRETYVGIELGRIRVERTTAADGDIIRDFDFLWLEVNAKKAFHLERGLAVDIGLGTAVFYVDGEEVSLEGGQEFSSPLADFGAGGQVFVDLSWRRRHLLLGLHAKYQLAFDVFEVDYSNLRLGMHLGAAF